MKGEGVSPWIVLVGPTGVGKTAVAEQMALALGTDIIAADSRHVYRGLRITTNKPTRLDQKRVARHLINLVSARETFSAGAYKKKAEQAISDLEANEKPILIEGGTGLYIKTLLYGLWESPPKDVLLRQSLIEMEEKEGEGTLHRKLQAIDPASAQKIHFKDQYKLMRALEVFYKTGRQLSHIHAEHQQKKKEGHPFIMIGLRRDRDDLYRRIEARVDLQFQKGLVSEIKRLCEKRLSTELPAMRTLGVTQIASYLNGGCTLDAATALLKRDTRHYAKRQMTWFSADTNITWLDLKEEETSDETCHRIHLLLTKKTAERSA
ncbi:MAG: tRNA (adenosine(37)-N6)-dimethylallyltransferase MiaA [Nitrospirota bacterium]